MIQIEMFPLRLYTLQAPTPGHMPLLVAQLQPPDVCTMI